MNFKDLLSKLDTIEGNTQQISECGDMPGDIMHPPKQQDNVTMNVSMNGSGAGGIADLMKILRSIEQGGEPHDAHALFGHPGSDDEKAEPIMGDNIDAMAAEQGEAEPAADGDEQVIADDWENAAPGASEHEVQGVSAVLPTGDDLASKGAEAIKVNGGGNPMHEALVDRLTQLYQSIK